MLLIFYEKAIDGIAGQLKGMMKPLIGEDEIKVYHTISILSKRLSGPILWQLIGMTFWIFMLFGNCLE
jgi:hydrogenase/urease accessory protein HupE